MPQHIKMPRHIQVTPRINPLGEPLWYHSHGNKLVLQPSGNGHIKIASNVAEIEITKNPQNFLVHYSIRTGHANITGEIPMTRQELKAAFGLSDKCQGFWAGLLHSYGGTVARQGKYIRYKRYLNIPGPGTSHDGDPNISLEIDDGIKKAIRRISR